MDTRKQRNKTIMAITNYTALFLDTINKERLTPMSIEEAQKITDMDDWDYERVFGHSPSDSRLIFHMEKKPNLMDLIRSGQSLPAPFIEKTLLHTTDEVQIQKLLKYKDIPIKILTKCITKHIDARLILEKIALHPNASDYMCSRIWNAIRDKYIDASYEHRNIRKECKRRGLL